MLKDTKKETLEADGHVLSIGNNTYGYFSPDHVVAVEILKDGDLKPVLSAWCEAADTLVGLFRADRRNTVLFNLVDLAADPDTILDGLRIRGKEPAQEEEARMRTAIASRDIDPVTLLMARQAVQGDARATRLWLELRAASLPGSHTGSTDLDRVQAAVTTIRTLRDTAGEVDTLRADMGRLRHEATAREARLAEMERLHEAATRELGEACEALVRNDARIEQLRAAVDDFSRSNAELEAQVATFEEERVEYNRRIDELLASRSWRVTKPLRFVGSVLRRRS